MLLTILAKAEREFVSSVRRKKESSFDHSSGGLETLLFS
jgi:hypothetical protein